MSEISPNDRQRLTAALESGRVRLSEHGKKYFEQARVIDVVNPDFTVVDVRIQSCWGPYSKDGNKMNQGGIEIVWTTVSAGFGSMLIVIGNDGEAHIESECMGKEFCKQVLAKLVDDSAID